MPGRIIFLDNFCVGSAARVEIWALGTQHSELVY
jgi:hypothetical protein